MVTSICPFCGDGMDGTPNDTDTARWYSKYHPDLAVHSTIPEPCYDCRTPYQIGEKVRLRGKSHDQIYRVKMLLERPNQPPLFEIVANNGLSTHVILAQLEHVERPGRAITPTTVADSPERKPGYF